MSTDVHAASDAAASDAAASDGRHPSGDARFELLDAAMRKARYAPDQLIELLHSAQDVFGHLSPDVLQYLARGLRLPPSKVYGVATFYHLFVFEPPGAHTCTVCTGTACFVKGSGAIVQAIEREHGVRAGATTESGELSLATARCLGSCGLAPVVLVDAVVAGHATPASALSAVAAAVADEDAE